MNSIKWALACILSMFLVILPLESFAKPESAAMAEQQVVHLNSADADTLAAVLKGIGLKRAQKIVEYRNAHGPFESVDDLIKVEGVGPSTLENNRDKIML